MLSARLGVRARILAVALIPSLTLLVIGVGVAGYLVNQGRQQQQWANTLQSSLGPAKGLVDAVQQERLLSLWRLGGDRSQSQALATARTNFNTSIDSLVTVDAQLDKASSGKMAGVTAGIDTLKQQLPALRDGIDAGILPVDAVYAIYNRILDGASQGTAIVQRNAPDAQVATGLAYANQLLSALEAYSRASALTASTLDGTPLSPALATELRNYSGYYQAAILPLAEALGGNVGTQLTALISTSAWQQTAAMQQAVLTTPPTKKTAETLGPPQFPMSKQDWLAATEQVSQALLEQWIAQSGVNERMATDTAAATIHNALVAGGSALVIAILAFLVALWLANRMIGRLQRLRTETLALAEVRLPETMRRLREGEPVDPETEAARLDFGRDEIGSVANAFNRAHTAAVTAAITEAKTREGVRAVFLNIAHRSQLVVHRQLELLDEVESKQEDPALLDTFFRLDHLATRERRNAENLIILGGGRPGRQWRRPVPLVELVRSAVGETLDYARVHTARIPQIFVSGDAVADVIHLLAELVDNATSFSPPQSRVDVTANRVGKGVVVEISDQGMGLSPEDLERHNEMLRNPPDFGLAALTADSRLGLFVVAQLGRRHAITVRLADSDYGGIRAIVLIPTALITTDASVADHLSDRMPVRRIPTASVTGEMPSVAGELAASSAVAIASRPAVDERPEDDFAAFDTPSPRDERSYLDEATRFDAPPHREEYQRSDETPRADTSARATDSAHLAELRRGVTPRRADTPRPETTHTPGDARPPLPRRRRQASLAPELSTSPERPSTPAATPTTRSAEQARDLFSAIENGTRQGRQAPPDTGNARPGGNPWDEQEGEGDYFPRR
ncbi:nitrate- and nitrite sensing domain-containing protein [Nocardia sp. NEAU-G5]|uniref:histidine kinase n=1 Tax=Nocardia albiluteola TaxID=2842303 RepID=A0ABS6B2Z5_9NOCA|nr:nitrate- and nitrite sensing domain-containing protein [Nocardia albiluteola]MBU3064670.1 nitrate- and nitrite sensing domain-containing protein [Nocardia albiluteola]